MKVAVYTIALNEEQFVERWYESVKDADYILIADTGSSDNTVELARSLGINVINVSVKPWRFDRARDAALLSIPSDIDYCIALDMDEVVVGDWRPSLEACLADGVTRPRYKYTWSWNDAEETVPGLEYSGDKIHSRSGYRWKHPVHEVMVTDRIEEKHGWCDFEIHHHPDNTKSRSSYLPLLEIATKEDPHDDRNAFYYGRELYFYGQYQDAAKELLRHLALPSAVWAPERAASMRLVAKCLPDQAEQWLELAEKESPGRREPLVDLASLYYQESRWEECLEASEKALDIKEKPLDYLCEAEAWGFAPYDFAAIAAHNLGMLDRAKAYSTTAWLLEPSNERLKQNAEICSRS